MNKDQLIQELKDFIVDVLDLEDVDPQELKADEPLMSEELGLTSIDMLELTVGVEKKYKVKIGNVETAKAAFQSISSLADFIIHNGQAT